MDICYKIFLLNILRIEKTALSLRLLNERLINASKSGISHYKPTDCTLIRAILEYMANLIKLSAFIRSIRIIRIPRRHTLKTLITCYSKNKYRVSRKLIPCRHDINLPFSIYLR